MALIKFLNDKLSNRKVEQGDYVFCESQGCGESFWGIYSSFLGKVIALDGAGSDYVYGNDLRIGSEVNYWIITKIIKCRDVVITIEDKNKSE